MRGKKIAMVCFFLVFLASCITVEVKDNVGNPISGVTVRLNTGETITTDQAGICKTTRLQPGTYTLVPEKTGFDFIPSSLGVVVKKGETQTVRFVGTKRNIDVSVKINNNIPGVERPRNIVAGKTSLLGAVGYYGGCPDRLYFKNLQDADQNDIDSLILCRNKDLTDVIAIVQMSSQGTILFQNIPEADGEGLLYIGGIVKKINYSENPAPEDTATAGRKIELQIYYSRFVASGGYLENKHDMAKTNIVAIQGEIPTFVGTSFLGGSLEYGIETIGNILIKTANTTNVNWDGSKLPLATAYLFCPLNISGVGIDRLYIEKRNGVSGKVVALDRDGNPSLPKLVNGEVYFDIDLAATYGSAFQDTLTYTDQAEYIISALVVNVCDTGYLQMGVDLTRSTFQHPISYDLLTPEFFAQLGQDEQVWCGPLSR